MAKILGLAICLLSLSAGPNLWAIAETSLGVSGTFENPRLKTAIVHPVASGSARERLFDLNAVPAHQTLPEHFLVGDGSLNRAVIEVDQTEGSPLDRILEGLTKTVSARAHDRVAVINYLALHLEDLVDGRWSLGKDSVGDNRWDPHPPPSSADLTRIYRQVFALPVGHAPIPLTGVVLPVVAFERFLLEPCSAYCLEKALLTRLLFDRLGVPSRFVAGAIVKSPKAGPRNYGHSWVVVPDSLKGDWIVDPTHHALGHPGASYPGVSEWFWFDHGYRFADQYYPAVTLDSQG